MKKVQFQTIFVQKLKLTFFQKIKNAEGTSIHKINLYSLRIIVTSLLMN